MNDEIHMKRERGALWVWFLWLALFYFVWLILVFGFDGWQDVAEHWPISIAMAIGSYASGSTPMGGGTVGFPVLVMLFEMPTSLGRDFSFVIQAIGMTSASIFIIVRRQPLAISMLKGAMLGSLIGTPVGIYFVAPHISELWVKLAFSIVLVSFGLLHIFRISEISKNIGFTKFRVITDYKIGFILSILATASVTAMTGVGVDMIIYCTLVLLYKADLKIAIPTSVIIMAFTSIIGVVVLWVEKGFQPGVYENWLAAAPIVILGAPLGVLAVNLIGRTITIYLVAFLCVIQFFWICITEYDELNDIGLLYSGFAILVILSLLELLRERGIYFTKNKNEVSPVDILTDIRAINVRD